MTGNCTGCWVSCAAAHIQGTRKNDPAVNAIKRLAQQRLHRIRIIWRSTGTPRATRLVARHRELGVPLIRPDDWFASASTPRPTALAHDHSRRQVSWLAGPNLPSPSRDPRSQWLIGGRFTAYSCGGSRGLEQSLARTAFPFDPNAGTVMNRLFMKCCISQMALFVDHKRESTIAIISCYSFRKVSPTSKDVPAATLLSTVPMTR